MIKTFGKTGKELAKTVSFSCSPELYRSMNSYVAERGCSRSWFMTKALESYLAECLEDKIDYDDAVAAWKEFEENGGKTISAEDLYRELGL